MDSEIRPHQSLRDEVRQAIIEAGAFVVLWSEHASQSDWVEKEWTVAGEHSPVSGCVFVLKLDDTPFANHQPPRLAARDKDEDRWRMIETLYSLTGIERSKTKEEIARFEDGLRAELQAKTDEVEAKTAGLEEKAKHWEGKFKWMFIALSLLLVGLAIYTILTSPRAIPPGTIAPFAGEKVPSGWALCDGSKMEGRQFDNLRKVLDDLWGGGKLPDLRGMFLRGANGFGLTPTRDHGPRRRPDGLDAGNAYQVGTTQSPTTAAPSTFEKDKGGPVVLDSNSYTGKLSKKDISGSEYVSWPGSWDKETRPKNAAVNWIIKL